MSSLVANFTGVACRWAVLLQPNPVSDLGLTSGGGEVAGDEPLDVLLLGQVVWRGGSPALLQFQLLDHVSAKLIDIHLPDVEFDADLCADDNHRGNGNPETVVVGAPHCVVDGVAGCPHALFD